MVAEAIVVCIDNSRWMQPESANFRSQWEAVKIYCKAKLEAHADTVVALYTMSSTNSRLLVDIPTRSLDKIIAQFPRIEPGSGQLDLLTALSFGRLPISRCIRDQNKKLRMLFLVGGLTNLSIGCVEDYGMQYKHMGIAVDIVNFYQGKIPESAAIDYRFGRSELNAFVKICNVNGNSHFVEVVRGSCIRDVLFKSILKETPCAFGKEKNKAAAADDEAQGSTKGNLYLEHPAFVDEEDWRIFFAPCPATTVET